MKLISCLSKVVSITSFDLTGTVITPTRRGNSSTTIYWFCRFADKLLLSSVYYFFVLMLSQAQVPIAEKVDKKATATDKSVQVAPDAIKVLAKAKYYYPHQPRPILVERWDFA